MPKLEMNFWSGDFTTRAQFSKGLHTDSANINAVQVALGPTKR